MSSVTHPRIGVGGQPATAALPPQVQRYSRREILAFYLCISPWLIGFLLFTLGPMLVSLGISFTKWDLLTAPEWIGARNYERMLRDPLFWQAWKVTLTYTALYVPTELIGGLLLALLMNQKVRGISIFRTIFYLPSVLSGISFVVVWMWILHPDAGLLNTALAKVGIQGPRWLLDPHTSLIALWMMSLWGLGRAAVIYLAGLQDIPRELLEAAAIDGANRWRMFRHVTLPLLTPTIFFNLVLSVIGTFQTFTSAYVATNGGPLDSTLFYVLYIYRIAFTPPVRMGYAAALAWILFIVVLILTLFLVRTSRRWVFYSGEKK